MALQPLLDPSVPQRTPPFFLSPSCLLQTPIPRTSNIPLDNVEFLVLLTDLMLWNLRLRNFLLSSILPSHDVPHPSFSSNFNAILDIQMFEETINFAIPNGTPQ